MAPRPFSHHTLNTNRTLYLVPNTPYYLPKTPNKIYSHKLLRINTMKLSLRYGKQQKQETL